MLAGVKTWEQYQDGQATLQKLKASSQWTGNSHLSIQGHRIYGILKNNQTTKRWQQMTALSDLR
jgi:hypothetical protein